MNKKLIEETIRWVGKKTTVAGYSERNIQLLTDECSQDLVNKISSNPMLADVKPLKDFLLALRFAEHPEIRKEAQRLLGLYFC